MTGERETRRDVGSRMVRGTLDAIHKTITGLDARSLEGRSAGIVAADVRQLLDGVEGVPFHRSLSAMLTKTKPCQQTCEEAWLMRHPHLER